MYLLEMFGVSLLLTLFLELPVAWMMGLRGKQYVLLVTLVNILTNPAAVLLCWLGVPQIPVEMAVVITEGVVYYRFSKEIIWRIDHPFRMSAICNAVSWLTGVLIQGIGGRL